jgi:hypothetical protein
MGTERYSRAAVHITRQPRLSRDELRDLFVASGIAILREEGLGAGGDLLTFKRVSQRIEDETGRRVTNASLIGRVWENQSDYQTEVLAKIASDDSSSEIGQTMEGVEPVLASMDPNSEDSRRWTLHEICRVTAASNTHALRNSTDWSLWIGIWAVTAVGSPPDRRQRVEEALEQAYMAVTERMEGIYSAGAAFTGYRVRAGLTMRQFTIGAAALAEGCALRDRVDSAHMNGIRRPTGRSGEDQEWTLFGLALEALAEQFFELDPDWEPAQRGADVGDVLNA